MEASEFILGTHYSEQQKDSQEPLSSKSPGKQLKEKTDLVPTVVTRIVHTESIATCKVSQEKKETSTKHF